MQTISAVAGIHVDVYVTTGPKGPVHVMLYSLYLYILTNSQIPLDILQHHRC